MTPEEFLAMVETRPDGEHWELIEGIAIMNASPTTWHQQIALNIGAALLVAKSAKEATWTPLLGISTRVPASPGSLPRPDVLVMEGEVPEVHTTGDGLILFEVLSRSNKKSDQAWRKRVYASIPNCQHYVTVLARGVEVVRYDRAAQWADVKANSLNANLDLPAIDVTIPLRDIYRWTPIK